MANIRAKDINQLEFWNQKELRKLRMTVKNRLSSLSTSTKPKELPENHPLCNMGYDDCDKLLEKILKAEKNLR